MDYKDEDLTDWFDGAKQKPEHIGVYRVRIGDRMAKLAHVRGPMYSFWNGLAWYGLAYRPNEISKSYKCQVQNRDWRGLKKNSLADQPTYLHPETFMLSA